MRGRKPRSTALKILRGNPGKRRLNLDEPIPAALVEDVPAELDTPDARGEWTRTIIPAIRTGQITSADRTLALAHCVLFATWRSQLKAAAKRPHVIHAGKHGYPMPNPARAMANTTIKILAGLDEKLGLTPTARGKVAVRGPAAAAPSALETKRARFLRGAASRG